MDNEIYVSSLRYAKDFDHNALVSGISRTYSQRGIAVKSEPILPGGKRADLAVALGNDWTFIEVKTCSNGTPQERRRLSFRQGFLRELLRLRAHSLRQLPRKHPSLMVLATSPSSNRRQAVSKIVLARSFAGRIFYHDSEKMLGLMIFAPFQNPKVPGKNWKYASALIPNPNRDSSGNAFDRLGSVQL